VEGYVDQYEYQPEGERRLWIDETNRIRVSPPLKWEMNLWAINIDGMSRDFAIRFLLEQTALASSDGINCRYVNMHFPNRSCMCARALMMLHDISEEEVSVEMFKRLLDLLPRRPNDFK
jgi:hypothetical protein